MITALLKSLGKMTPEERLTAGPAVHGLRESITARSPTARLRWKRPNSTASSRPKRWT
jgi:hypothetical protein